MWFKNIGMFLLVSVMSVAAMADTVSNPCDGLLNIVDRPTASDSACAVPFKEFILEFGYQYQQLTHSAGQQQNFPDAELRIGLPASNELSIVLPNYIHQSQAPHSGATATTVALKHEVGYNQNWLGAVEAVFVLPSGSTAFGSDGLGSTLNVIVGYTIDKYNLTLMLGGSSYTQSTFEGGQRYTTINPDLVFTYSAMEKMDVYAEVYGQSRTAPKEGSGFNADVGVLFLLMPKLEIDFEVGQRVSGNLVGFNHYVGTGMALQF